MLLTTAPALKPTEVQAANDLNYNQYQLTVPSDLKLTTTGWNTIGTVTVKGGYSTSTDSYFPTGTKLVVSITTTNGYKLKSASGSTIPYSLNWTTLKFSRKDLASEGGGSSTLSANITASAYDSAPDGTYTDTINYRAGLQKETVTLKNAGGALLTSNRLGTPRTFIYREKTYYAYDRMTYTTAYSSGQDAQDFVAQLNATKYDGYSNWQLLSEWGMAREWWEAAGRPETFSGTLYILWGPPATESRSNCWDMMNGEWTTLYRFIGYREMGFFVLRPAD